MNENERKAQLAEMTGCLQCRCPGFQVMTRVECKGINGIRYCYFACQDPDNPEVETRHPVGEALGCRCSLGRKVDMASVRFFEDAEANWGFMRCLKIGGLEAPLEDRKPKTNAAAVWPIAIGVGALLWFVTSKGVWK